MGLAWVLVGLSLFPGFGPSQVELWGVCQDRHTKPEDRRAGSPSYSGLAGATRCSQHLRNHPEHPRSGYENQDIWLDPHHRLT